MGSCVCPLLFLSHCLLFPDSTLSPSPFTISLSPPGPGEVADGTVREIFPPTSLGSELVPGMGMGTEWVGMDIFCT